MARMGGSFPFPTAQIAEGGQRVSLASGGVFYPPAGEYIVITDSLSVVEFFDPIQNIWNTIVPASNGDWLSCDGFNYRVRNTSGTLTSLSITAGSGMQNGIGPTAAGAVAASIAASNTAGGVRATVWCCIGGSVQAPTIAQAGSGFVQPPVVVIDPPPTGGLQATATAAITAGGALASITMNNVGGGYAASPNFWLIPQPLIYQGAPQGGVAAAGIPVPGLIHPNNAAPGNQNTSTSAGALLTSNALTGSGTLTAIQIANPGGGYTSANPAVTFTNGAGGVASTATVGNTTPAVSTVILQPRVQ